MARLSNPYEIAYWKLLRPDDDEGQSYGRKFYIRAEASRLKQAIGDPRLRVVGFNEAGKIVVEYDD